MIKLFTTEFWNVKKVSAGIKSLFIERYGQFMTPLCDKGVLAIHLDSSAVCFNVQFNRHTRQS